jgi:hypothetical protein
MYTWVSEKYWPLYSEFMSCLIISIKITRLPYWAVVLLFMTFEQGHTLCISVSDVDFIELKQAWKGTIIVYEIRSTSNPSLETELCLCCQGVRTTYQSKDTECLLLHYCTNVLLQKDQTVHGDESCCWQPAGGLLSGNGAVTGAAYRLYLRNPFQRRRTYYWIFSSIITR